MAFTSSNEIEITGGTEAERAAAAALVLAIDSVEEASSSTSSTSSLLFMKFESVDGLPEEDLGPIAAQFPSLAFTLVYYSKDGEFYGYAKVGSDGSDAASDDFDEDTAEVVGRRYDGDRLAFVRSTYGLPDRAG